MEIRKKSVFTLAIAIPIMSISLSGAVLASALQNDPGRIFDLVRNHFAYVPAFGSTNGATATLYAGRGNDRDQTSLFIALMRAAGYETWNQTAGDKK